MAAAPGLAPIRTSLTRPSPTTPAPTCAPTAPAPPTRATLRGTRTLIGEYSGIVECIGYYGAQTAPPGMLPRRDAPGRQPTLVPLSRLGGTVWPFFSALNSARASVWFHSTESPAFV
jgi:hypothetical protein